MVNSILSHILQKGFCKKARNGLGDLSLHLFVVLMVLSVLPYGAPATCGLDDIVEKAVTDKHNEYRQKIAQRGLDKKTYGNLMGSDAMFKLTYDCTYESMAGALISPDCTRSKHDVTKMGNAGNFKHYPAFTKPSTNDLAHYFKAAVKDWAQINSPLKVDVIYRDDSMNSFANIINYRTLRFGCQAKWCTSEELALACVYSSLPKKGEPLYLAKPGSNQGCTDDSTCKDVVKADGQCEVAKGLCTTSADTIDAATTSAPSQLPTLPTQPTPTTPPTAVITIPATATNDVMTQAIRDKIVYMHNWHRSEVAQGRVRNGKDGKDNFKEASDMYKMSYDMSLEADAQIRAKTCSSGFSDRSHRSSGENVYVNSSTTMPYLQVVSEGMEYWRGEVDTNGMNYRMQFIKNLETKPNSPLDYIQMVWASSYKVGCGVARCPFGTVFVCRYYPRGRIRDHYIYHTGGLCESCKDGCSKGLCPAP